MDKTICRFECWNVLEAKDAKGKKVEEQITMSAATTIPEEEEHAGEVNSFSKFTPSGKFEIVVTNPAVFGFFRSGFHYYLTVEEVPKEKQFQWIQDILNGKSED